MHNFFTNDGTPPADLRKIGRAQLARYPSVQIWETAVAGVKLVDDAFTVAVDNGAVLRGRRLLLATGLSDELPPIDGLATLWGRSAFHCPYCHGYEVTGRPIAVIGAEVSRVRLAVHLARFSDDVVLCTNGSAEIDTETRQLLEAQGVAVRDEPIERFEADGDQLTRIVFPGGASLDRAAVFISTMLRQTSELAEQLGCMIFPDGMVAVDEFGRTSVPGVSAVGDMARRATVPMPLAAVVVAAASGTIAAGVIDQDLLSVDTGLPNPFAKA